LVDGGWVLLYNYTSLSHARKSIHCLQIVGQFDIFNNSQ